MLPARRASLASSVAARSRVAELTTIVENSGLVTKKTGATFRELGHLPFGPSSISHDGGESLCEGLPGLEKATLGRGDCDNGVP